MEGDLGASKATSSLGVITQKRGDERRQGEGGGHKISKNGATSFMDGP